MGSDQKQGPAPVKMSTPAEIKTYMMIAQNRLTLNRNKKIESIRKKKNEIAKSLKDNNLDVAKAKMDSLIREEDYITVYDILGPLLEILKERVTYIISNNECPPDLRAQLDSVIYASTRLEFEELMVLRDMIMRRYGAAYIQKADNNADKLVNINLIEKLKIKPASDAFVTIRLKQLCKEKKIPFEFPSEIISDIPDGINNPFGPPGNNPGDFNPYASVQGNNPYGPPPGDNPYGPQQGNNPYGQPPGNNNPYGPPPGDNPYGQPPGNNNPYGSMQGPPQGNNNIPYGSQQGPPPGNNNSLYGPPPGTDNNPFGSQQGPPQGNDNNNPFGSQQGPPPGNNNQFGSQQGPPPGNDNNPFASQQGPHQGSNNPYASQQGGNNNPYGSQANNPFNSDPLGGETLLKTQNPNMSQNKDQSNEPPKSNNPYFSNNNNNTSSDSNPFAGDNNNPFSNNMSNSNPYGNNSEKKDDGFPKIDNDDSNPYA